MKTNTIALLILLFLSSSCSDKAKTKVKDNKPVSNSLSDNSALFESITSDDSNTLFVLIDPHADGKLALSKFKDISSELNLNVIALNNVKNNIKNFEELITRDIAAFNGNKDKMFFVGFSGGARMAYQYAIKHRVAGLIMCGAGIGNEMNIPHSFPIMLVSGTKDFNYLEQYYSPFSKLSKDKSLISMHFYGIHEWPPEQLLKQASKFILEKSNTGFKAEFSSEDIMKQYSSYLNNNEQFQAFKQLELLSKVFPSDASVKEQMEAYLTKKEFIFYMKNFEKIMQNEINRNKALVKNLPVKDIDWWFKVLDELDVDISSKSSKLQYESYCRTKAYMGVVMYSYVGREMQNPNSKNLKKYIRIYEKLEPENEDMLRFKNMIIGN